MSNTKCICGGRDFESCICGISPHDYYGFTARSEPTKKWRIIRGGRGNYRTHSFTTKVERDEAGRRWMGIDHDSVALESWSAEHPQDDLNKGWACDEVIRPKEAEVSDE